ncbi:MAG TPA: outer membrane beta-barrel protein [Hanamia sp.]|nr:outer membrane beta-barrel protein [Hanamia sp.]
MKENNKHKADMQKLAEEGWKQMHETLREQGLSNDDIVGPASSKRRNIILLIAACLFFMLIISYPFVTNEPSYFSLNSKNKMAHSSENTSENSLIATKNVAANNVSSSPLGIQQKMLLHQKINAQVSQIEKENVVAAWQLQRTSLLKKFSFAKEFKTSIPASDELIDTAVPLQRVEFLQTEPVIKNSKRIKAFAGVGINLSAGKKPFDLADVNFHPSITFVIPVSKKVSFHTGLSALSTIHGKEVSAREKELQNSFSSNIYYNINTTSIIKASYFDVPLTLHYSISKNWSVGSGLQLSKLYKVNIKEQKQSFDYNNTLYSATVQQINATPTRAAAVFQKKLEVKKFETRFVAETNYETGKFLLSAGYYYGLGKTISLKDAINSDHQYRNVYFKLGVQYRVY